MGVPGPHHRDGAMRQSVKQEALRIDSTLKCKREPHDGGLAFVVRDGNGEKLGHDHFDAASAWRTAYRKVLDR
jgi:hypothetical protein